MSTSVLSVRAPLHRLLIGLLASSIILTSITPADAASPFQPAPAVPDPLSAWVPWVLHHHKSLQCTSTGKSRACVWPGRLTVQIDDRGGRFALEVHRDRPGWVRLPGSSERWPQDVKSGEQRAFVGKDSEGRPRVQLMAGLHKITGSWAWKTPPEVLAVPDNLALTQVVRSGTPVPRVRREGERLWLRQGAGPRDTVRDSLRVRVQRRIDDGVPLRIKTRLLLQVAGRARDVDLGPLLLAGSVPKAVKDGGLPVQVTAAGRVRVHVRPGRHQLEIAAVLPTDMEALDVPAHASATGLEDVETWVFFSNVQVRTVEVRGGTTVDPERTRLGKDWRGGSSFLLQPGEKLNLRTTRRGEVEAPPNRLRVRRDIWLDGGGLTIKDRLMGEMQRDWRMDFAGAGHLGRVYDRREKRDLLITTRPTDGGGGHPPSSKPNAKGGKSGAQQGPAGVELRQGKINLEAVSRMTELPKTMKAVGWHADVQSLQATLHLPPGWTLLSANGVDQVPNTWLSSWTLFDFFLVLMVALGTARLIGWQWGALALLALALAHGQSGAPEWVWLSLLSSLALVRALPEGWFRKGAQLWRGLTMVTLVLILVPFSVLQVRHGVYPQISHGDSSRSWTDLNLQLGEKTANGLDNTMKEEDGRTATSPAESLKRYSRVGKAGSGKRKKSIQQRRNRQLSQVDPKAVVQTGPGLPDWSWSKWPLRWSGPVAKDHTLELILLSPAMNLALAILRVVLLIALGLALLEVKKLQAGMRRWMRGQDGDDDDGDAGDAVDTAPTAASTTALLLAVGLAAGLMSFPTQAHAGAVPKFQRLKKTIAPVQQQQQTQSNQLNATRVSLGGGVTDDAPGGGGVPPAWALKALEQRLVAAQTCPSGGCIVTPRATLKITNRAVTLTAEVHAARTAAWTLPDGIDVTEVRIDGQPTWQLRRTDGLQVRVPSGHHSVTITGALPPGRIVTLRFDATSRPAYLALTAEGWRVDGLGQGGVPEGSLQLTHKAGAERGEAQAEALQTELPAWYTVDRELLLGLPWKVMTTVRRPRTARAALLRFPLLPSEAVISAGVRVERGKDGGREAIVHLPRGVRQVQFESELPTTARIDLQAPKARPWTETWTLHCSPIWRCKHKGLPPVHRRDQQGDLAPLWQPWPGEAVTIHIARPSGTAGQTTTIDRVDYSVKPGSRLLEGTLKLKLRASQGGTRKLTLPANADLQRVTINQKERSLRATATKAGNVVQVPIRPGSQQIELRWQQPWERTLSERVPAVHVGGPAANVRVTVTTGEDRWLLWAFGPRWGPAVLFWSHLFILILLAIGLGRLRFLPLKTSHWLLLCLGFAQLPTPALLPVVGFFLAFSWRESFWRTRPAPQLATPFALTQIGLIGVMMIFLIALYAAIHSNLLMDLDMQVKGTNSHNGHLVWYVDRTDGALPMPGTLSLPIIVWRVAMLLWSLWLVSALLKWLQWAWRCFADGGLWRKFESTPAPQQPTAQQEAKSAPIPPPPPQP